MIKFHLNKITEILKKTQINFYPFKLLVLFYFILFKSSLATSQTFTPSSIPGLKLWLTGDSVHTTINNNVDTCFDLSGNHNHAVQINPNAQPNISSQKLNTHKILEFSGNNDNIIFNRITDIRTVFWVTYENPSISPQLIPILGDDNFYDFYRGANKNIWDQTFTHPNILNGNTKINGINVNGLTTTIPTDFSILSLTTTGNVQANNFSQDRIVPGRSWVGGFAELIIYNTQLSTNQITQVENYLADKYAPPVDLGPDIQLSYGFCDTSLTVGTLFKSVSWSTGDTTSTINVSKTGKYWVNTVDIFGRASSDTVNVNFPIVKIPNDNIICLGDSEYWSTGLDQNDYIFLWNDGSSTDKILLDTLSDFYVTITDSTGCKYFSDTLNFTINSFPSNSLLGADTIFCGPNFIKIIPALDSIKTLIWSTGSHSDSIFISQSGFYELNAVNNFNCKRNDTIYILVNIPPNFSLGPDTSICFTNSVILNTGLNNCDFLWSDNSTNQSLTVYSNGIYWAKATDTLGCSFSDSISINVDTTFKYATLGPDTTLCSGSFIYFNGTAFNNGINLLWSDNSTNNNLQILTGGVYWIKAVNANGCSIKDSIDITISGSVPLISFTANNTCFGNQNNFSNTSVAANGDSILGYFWDFGDGTGDTIINPSHTYQDTGYFFINLYVNTLDGCKGSKMDTIQVFPNPTANFSTSTNFCRNVPVQFFDSSQTFGYPIGTWSWNFNDPNSPNNNSSSNNPTHLFSSAGNYQISLHATSINGCTDSNSINLFIKPSPIADFNSGLSCASEKIQFTDISNLQGLQPANFYWNFSGTEGDSANSVEFIFSDTGTYSVKHIIQTNNGCSDTVSKNITVYPKPSSDFSFVGLCDGDTLLLFDSSTIETGAITAWQWYLNNQLISTQENIDIINDSVGIQQVSLIVSSSNGCKDTTIKDIQINPSPEPVFSFNPNEGVAPLTVNFTNQTGGVNSYTWNFGDSTLSNLIEPIHEYQDTGTFDITLTVISSEGCASSATTQLIVNAARIDVSAIGLETTNVGDFIKFTGQFKNEGNLEITYMELYARMENSGIIKEIWTGSLPKGGVLIHEFGTQLYNNKQGNYVCTNVKQTNQMSDANSLNNEYCRTLGENDFEIFNCYPNPSANEIVLPANFNFKDEFTLSIFSSEGKLISSLTKKNEVIGFQLLPLDIRSLDQGVYFLQLEFRGIKKTSRFLKKSND